MSRYIDADALIQHIENLQNINSEDDCFCGNLQAFKSILNFQPTADVVEHKRGEWSLNVDDWFGDCYKCSACGEEFILNEGNPKDNGYNYCPNCGADMRGERDG